MKIKNNKEEIIEPHLELSEEANKDIELSKKEYLQGNFSTFDEVKKELEL